MRHIYRNLRHGIVNLTLTPGSAIAKNELANTFRVSPTPVREALLRLSEEGLVDIFPQSGTVISFIDVQHAEEAHFLRLSVEIEVAKTLCETIDDEGMDSLNAWIERQVTELQAGDQTAFKLADNQFHMEMFRLAGVQGLTRLIDRRRGHYDRIRSLYLIEHKRREVVIREHRAIFAAFRKSDAAEAEAAVRRHLGKSLAAVNEIKERHPRYFSESSDILRRKGLGT